MTDRRKCFTFVWKIKNFNFSFSSLWSFDSPVFILHSLYRTRWNIVLYTNSTTFKNCVACYLERQRYDFGPDQLELDYELSLIASDGSVIQSQSFLRKAYKKAHVDWTAALIANREEVFVHKKKIFMPNDAFTVRCRMWKSQGLISESARCSVETRIDVECRSFFGVIEKFTSIKPSSKSKVCFKSSSEEILLSSMDLCVDDAGELTLQIKPVDYEPKVMYEFRVFILDVFKSKVKSASKKFYDTNSSCIPFTFSKEHLIENKGLYLPNDVLTLECEIFFPTSHKLEKIDDMLYEYDCEDIHSVISNANSSTEGCHTESVITLKEGLISLFSEGILCDTQLKTATKTFPAHKVVLSALSPVFKSMFETDMREKTSNCVEIEDLDATTVRQMLLFLYSDTLDNLDYESAKSLYFAADKYHIVSLRHMCSNFLKENLLYSNCCDVLLLADKHQDKDLKISVQDCIADNDEVVLFSDEWKTLVENEPRLTTEILLGLYMKNRKIHLPSS